eukprot:GSChrysophyteH2.ASY1.ANO1.329.1 assembled CDS
MQKKQDSQQDFFLRIAAVSYEGSVFGWDVKPSTANEDPEGLQCSLRFGFNATKNSLKAIAVSDSGRYMVCGGMDEHIRVFNVAENRSLGELSGHTGAVTCLQFVGDKFIVSGSEDYSLCIWRVQDWSCLHILGGHKAAINGISVHPTGKLALSVSKDNTLKVWNLVQGRCAFTRRLHGPADKVHWNSAGSAYLLVVGRELQVYNASDNACTATVKFNSRVNQARFVDAGTAGGADGAIALVLENKTVQVLDMAGGELCSPYSLSAALAGGRPRDLFCCAPCIARGSAALQDVLQGEKHSLVVVSSNGRMAVLSARALIDGPPAASDDGDGGGDEEAAEEDAYGAGGAGAAFAVQTLAAVGAEPRLVAVAAWNPHFVDPSKKKGKKGADAGVEGKGAEKKEVEEETEATEAGAEGEQERGTKAAKGGKNKRKSQPQPAGGSATKKHKVRFS